MSVIYTAKKFKTDISGRTRVIDYMTSNDRRDFRDYYETNGWNILEFKSLSEVIEYFKHWNRTSDFVITYSDVTLSDQVGDYELKHKTDGIIYSHFCFIKAELRDE